MNERDRIDFHGTLPESVVKKLQEMYPTPILDDDLEALAKKVGGTWRNGLPYGLPSELLSPLRTSARYGRI